MRLQYVSTVCCLITLLAAFGCNRTAPSQAILTQETRPTPGGSGPGVGIKPHIYNRVTAFCIGINKYRSGGVPPLMFAESDAKAVADQLQAQYGYQPYSFLARRPPKKLSSKSWSSAIKNSESETL